MLGSHSKTTGTCSLLHLWGLALWSPLSWTTDTLCNRSRKGTCALPTGAFWVQPEMLLYRTWPHPSPPPTPAFFPWSLVGCGRAFLQQEVDLLRGFFHWELFLSQHPCVYLKTTGETRASLHFPDASLPLLASSAGSLAFKGKLCPGSFINWGIPAFSWKMEVLLQSRSSRQGFLTPRLCMTLMSDEQTCHQQLAFLSLCQMSPNLSVLSLPGAVKGRSLPGSSLSSQLFPAPPWHLAVSTRLPVSSLSKTRWHFEHLATQISDGGFQTNHSRDACKEPDSL